jgi:transcriptional regulator with GAF, ATPase, and Fis domain
MPLEMQAKILRVLQDKVITPVGGQSSYQVNIRILAATHQDLMGQASGCPSDGTCLK